jgi:hypothetical protein
VVRIRGQRALARGVIVWASYDVKWIVKWEAETRG